MKTRKMSGALAIRSALLLVALSSAAPMNEANALSATIVTGSAGSAASIPNCDMVSSMNTTLYTFARGSQLTENNVDSTEQCDLGEARILKFTGASAKEFKCLVISSCSSGLICQKASGSGSEGILDYYCITRTFTKAVTR